MITKIEWQSYGCQATRDDGVVGTFAGFHKLSVDEIVPGTTMVLVSHEDDIELFRLESLDYLPNLLRFLEEYHEGRPFSHHIGVMMS